MTSTLAPLSPEERGADELWFDRVLRRYCRFLEYAIAACLAGMVALVFTNVILRYVFNSGLDIAEELSRWLFVWLTFLGAVVGMHRHAHLGTEVLVGRLGPAGRKVCLVIGYALMFMVCWQLFSGSWTQTVINWDVSAPTTGWSMAWVYGVGLVFSLSAAVILAADLFKLLTGRVSDDDLIIIKESEG
ncbi:TRAP transporter small permease [Variovorax sp. J2P1-59]|uniref:TRAP transporter small permease n=1 Tax=Variovorax flavidus TaxID=3053501 RepID=UPI002574FA89|nr:TRAP transporter small permease [Variovorax sp. J2P1-59]MDM0078788.1 TRAP transporter small permease [Variovorax sp. J2P1-59]